MPIDSAIPLSVVPPKIESPTQSLSQVYALRESQARLHGTQLENTARQQENDARTRAAADDAAIKSELSNAYDPASGSVDYQKAINRLHQGGHGTAAIKLADDFSKRQQQHAATAEAELKRHSADLEIGTQVLAGVHNDKDPENDDARWKAAKQHFVGMKDIAPDAAAMIAQLPDDYASAKPHIDMVISEGTKMADRIREAHESLRDHNDAVERGILRPDPKKGEQESPDLAKKRAEAEQLQTSSAARSLAGARNDAEYQQILSGFKSQQYAPSILNKFAPVWSPAAVEKAKSLTMTPREYEELGIQRTNASANVTRANAAEERAKNATPTITREDQKAYEDARNEYDKGHPVSTKPVPKFEKDPVTGRPHLVGMETPTRVPFMSIEEWKKNNGKAPAGPPAAPAVAVPPAITPRPVPPPVAAPGATPAAPVPPAAAVSAPTALPVPPAPSPSLGANVRPPAPAGGAVQPQGGGVRVKLPPDKDHPQGRIVRFKDKASADAFAKAAGFTFTK